MFRNSMRRARKKIRMMRELSLLETMGVLNYVRVNGLILLIYFSVNCHIS